MMRRVWRDGWLALRWTWRNTGFSALAANGVVFALVTTVVLVPLP